MRQKRLTSAQKYLLLLGEFIDFLQALPEDNEHHLDLHEIQDPNTVPPYLKEELF